MGSLFWKSDRGKAAMFRPFWGLQGSKSGKSLPIWPELSAVSSWNSRKWNPKRARKQLELHPGAASFPARGDARTHRRPEYRSAVIGGVARLTRRFLRNANDEPEALRRHAQWSRFR